MDHPERGIWRRAEIEILEVFIWLTGFVIFKIPDLFRRNRRDGTSTSVQILLYAHNK
jgi:hypothetical protein